MRGAQNCDEHLPAATHCHTIAQGGRRPRIVPRFRWEVDDVKGAQNVLLFPKALGQAIKKVARAHDTWLRDRHAQVVDACRCDGAVLELWRELAEMGAARNEQGREAMHALIAAVATPLRDEGKVCGSRTAVDHAAYTAVQVVVLVIPPLLAFGEDARQQLKEAGYPVDNDFLASDYKVGMHWRAGVGCTMLPTCITSYNAH